MILVDSSVWVDYFRGTITPETDFLDAALGYEPLAVGDLVLTEVLQGFHSDRQFNQARKLMTSLSVVALGGEAVAIQAAKNFRILRSQGITIRKTTDTIIATRCLMNRFSSLYSDRELSDHNRAADFRIGYRADQRRDSRPDLLRPVTRCSA